MAGPFFLIIFICFISISTTTGYNILDRISNKFDNQNLLFSRTSIQLKSTFNDCIPVQAVKNFNRPFIENDRKLFGPVSDQHQLCYACGFVQGITKRKCDQLSIIHMYELCSKNSSSKSDCLKTRFSVLNLLQQDVYHSSNFSSECYDQCVLNYLLSSVHPE